MALNSLVAKDFRVLRLRARTVANTAAAETRERLGLQRDRADRGPELQRERVRAAKARKSRFESRSTSMDTTAFPMTPKESGAAGHPSSRSRFRNLRNIVPS